MVGAIAAALQGAPLVTLDVDVVHRRSPGNLDRLLDALRALGAVYRDPAGRTLAPGSRDLQGKGHHLLMTRLGPLDVLGAIEGGRDYDELIGRSVEVALEPGLSFRVLALEALVDLKKESTREKDRAMLPLLQRTLEEQKRR